MKIDEEKLAEVVVGWLGILVVIFGACMLGLILSLVKAAFLLFGINLNYL